MAARTEGTSQPRGMMDMPGMTGDDPMEVKTRAHLLHMRGAMVKAMAEGMVQDGQTLRETQERLRLLSQHPPSGRRGLAQVRGWTHPVAV